MSNIPFEFDTNRFVKQQGDADLDNIICNDLSKPCPYP